jgi:molybdopterin converting factor small subunit
MTATLRMLAFAGARDAVGAPEVDLAFDELAATSATAAGVLAWACKRWPGLEPYRGCIRVAVNGTYAEPTEPVAPGDEVALIPPVAGG